MLIHLDALGGIAGDMFIAAVLDAWPELTDGMLAAVQATGLPPSWAIAIEEHGDGVLRGKRFSVLEPAQDGHAEHVTLGSILHRLHEAPLQTPVRERAAEIFQLLAEAEAAVHGVEVDEVAFHEVGAWDSVADIIGAAYLIDALGPASWRVGPVPLGGGRINTVHGMMPVPAPATMQLLKDFEMLDDGVHGERVTPTGAAILRHLVSPTDRALHAPIHAIRLCRSGTGFGMRVLPGLSNVLRVLVFDDAGHTTSGDRVCVLQFEIDDQTGEDLAQGLELLRSYEGVLDVLQVPAVGKKGRMVAQVQVLCQPEALQEVINGCFIETTTIGLRWMLSNRAKLERKTEIVDSAGAKVTVKLARRPGGSMSAKTEAEFFRGISGQRQRELERANAAADALLRAGLTEIDIERADDT
jgi:pyridinium-3,5-bisthiocarboxylic acid mononucleotide nickel chelatase